MLRRLIAVFIALAGLPGAASGQQGSGRSQAPLVLEPSTFLYRDGLAYKSYGFEDFRQPDFTQYARVNYFSQMGDPLIRGYDLYSWTEMRTNALTEAARSSRTIPRWSRFERNVVAKDSQAGWSGSLIIGDEIRTLFTPLTLRLVGFDGVRLDSRTGHVKTIGIAQRWMGQQEDARYGQVPTWWDWDTATEIRDAGFLLGGHGDVETGAMSLGASAVSFHLFDSEQAQFDLRGQLQSRQVLPSFLIVRFADDSPEDGQGGATVNDLELYVNGELRRDLVPFVVKANSQNPTAVGKSNALTGQFRRSIYDHKGTFFGDVLYLRRHLAGDDVSREVNLPELLRYLTPDSPDGPWQADGYDIVLAYFDLRSERYVRQVQVRSLVGNDYRAEALGMSESDPASKQEDLRWRVAGQMTTSKTPYIFPRESPGVRALKRASGNVQDLSNLDWVTLDVGEWTGRVTMGLNGAWESGNAEVRWEYARSLIYSQYPDGTPGYRSDKEVVGVRDWRGERSSVGAGAYYLTALWRRGRWEAGGEVFSLEGRFDGGLVEDNDDNDRYPDLGAGHRPVIFFTAPDYDPDGVFPGKDADHDGIPDTNRNGNELPDYAEPFLRFDVEPDDYVYGRDWNANGVPDEREDDLRSDFPYDVDQRGTHAYGRVQLLYGVSLGGGRLHARGISSGGRNDNTYGRAVLEQGNPSWGRIRLEALWQRIHDDIENPYARFEETLSGSNNFPVYQRNVVKDMLFWRNSMDHTYYLEGEWRVLPGVHFWGNLRHELNRQLGGQLSDGSVQAPDRVRLWTGVVRGECVWEPGPQWRVSAQAKGLLLKQARSSLPVDLANQWTVMPVVKVQYRFTPKTEILAGLEGVPGLPLRVEDRADGLNSVEEKVRAVQVTNRSSYYGYEIAMNLGVRQRQRRYQDPGRAVENLDVTTLFMRVIMGFDE